MKDDTEASVLAPVSAHTSASSDVDLLHDSQYARVPGASSLKSDRERADELAIGGMRSQGSPYRSCHLIAHWVPRWLMSWRTTSMSTH